MTKTPFLCYLIIVRGAVLGQKVLHHLLFCGRLHGVSCAPPTQVGINVACCPCPLSRWHPLGSSLAELDDNFGVGAVVRAVVLLTDVAVDGTAEAWGQATGRAVERLHAVLLHVADDVWFERWHKWTLRTVPDLPCDWWLLLWWLGRTEGFGRRGEFEAGSPWGVFEWGPPKRNSWGVWVDVGWVVVVIHEGLPGLLHIHEDHLCCVILVPTLNVAANVCAPVGAVPAPRTFVTSKATKQHLLRLVWHVLDKNGLVLSWSAAGVFLSSCTAVPPSISLVLRFLQRGRPAIISVSGPCLVQLKDYDVTKMIRMLDTQVLLDVPLPVWPLAADRALERLDIAMLLGVAVLRGEKTQFTTRQLGITYWWWRRDSTVGGQARVIVELDSICYRDDADLAVGVDVVVVLLDGPFGYALLPTLGAAKHIAGSILTLILLHLHLLRSAIFHILFLAGWNRLFLFFLLPLIRNGNGFGNDSNTRMAIMLPALVLADAPTIPRAKQAMGALVLVAPLWLLLLLLLWEFALQQQGSSGPGGDRLGAERDAGFRVQVMVTLDVGSGGKILLDRGPRLLHGQCHHVLGASRVLAGHVLANVVLPVAALAAHGALELLEVEMRLHVVLDLVGLHIGEGAQLASVDPVAVFVHCGLRAVAEGVGQAHRVWDAVFVPLLHLDLSCRPLHCFVLTHVCQQKENGHKGTGRCLPTVHCKTNSTGNESSSWCDSVWTGQIISLFLQQINFLSTDNNKGDLHTSPSSKLRGSTEHLTVTLATHSQIHWKTQAHACAHTLKKKIFTNIVDEDHYEKTVPTVLYN